MAGVRACIVPTRRGFGREANLTEGVDSKAMLREGRQEGGDVKDGLKQTQSPGVPGRAMQGEETHDRDWSWVEATVWTERMLSALGNGVKGNKWSSTLAKSILRGSRIVRHARRLAKRETAPMRKPPTGAPYAGELHVRFGGRGDWAFPTPIITRVRYPTSRNPTAAWVVLSTARSSTIFRLLDA